MYLSICKKDFNAIKRGELFDTYQEVNYAFIRLKGSKGEFERLPFQEYTSYFNTFEDCMFLPTVHKETKLRGLFKKKEKVIYREQKEFLMFQELHFDDLKKMQLSIFEPIEQLSKIVGIENYTERLYKVLKQIEYCQKVAFPSRQDIQENINKAEVIVKEIEIEISKQLVEN